MHRFYANTFPKTNASRVSFSSVLETSFVLFSVMNDSWPVTLPEKSVGEGFSGLGLGWGLDDRRAERQEV